MQRLVIGPGVCSSPRLRLGLEQILILQRALPSPRKYYSKIDKFCYIHWKIMPAGVSTEGIFDFDDVEGMIDKCVTKLRKILEHCKCFLVEQELLEKLHDVIEYQFKIKQHVKLVLESQSNQGSISWSIILINWAFLLFYFTQRNYAQYHSLHRHLACFFWQYSTSCPQGTFGGTTCVGHARQHKWLRTWDSTRYICLYI